MGKLIESTFTTLDGVISDPQIYGPAYWDDEHGGYASKLMQNADALLLGRVTYEGFAQVWPTRAGDPMADHLNAMPKYVASTTLNDAGMTWNATLLGDEVAGDVAKLKEQPGDLLKYGTGEFDRVLLENKLVDEYHFWIFPVFAGSGQRLFDGFELTHLKLADQTTMKNGITVNVYAPQ